MVLAAAKYMPTSIGDMKAETISTSVFCSASSQTEMTSRGSAAARHRSPVVLPGAAWIAGSRRRDDEQGLHQRRRPGRDHGRAGGSAGIGRQAEEVRGTHGREQQQRAQHVGREQADRHPSAAAADAVLHLAQRAQGYADERKADGQQVGVMEAVAREPDEAKARDGNERCRRAGARCAPPRRSPRNSPYSPRTRYSGTNRIISIGRPRWERPLSTSTQVQTNT